jgi:hypothetical protein
MMRRLGARVVGIQQRWFNHGLTRDVGAWSARGRILVYINQDATPASVDWLEGMVRPLLKDDPTLRRGPGWDPGVPSPTPALLLGLVRRPILFHARSTPLGGTTPRARVLDGQLRDSRLGASQHSLRRSGDHGGQEVAARGCAPPPPDRTPPPCCGPPHPRLHDPWADPAMLFRGLRMETPRPPIRMAAVPRRPGPARAALGSDPRDPQWSRLVLRRTLLPGDPTPGGLRRQPVRVKGPALSGAMSFGSGVSPRQPKGTQDCTGSPSAGRYRGILSGAVTMARR